jgi:O-antigen/teichoic acid export membrane protein
MKKSIVINSYLVFPILTFLAVAAAPIIELLLTDKWMPMVPFMQICCLIFAFHPLASTQMQAIAAVGRSDVRLKIEVLKKGIGILLLVLMMNYGPMGIAISAAITGIIGVIIGAIAGRVTTGYPLKRLISDIGPIIIASIMMGIPMYFVGKLLIHPILLVVLEFLVGAIVYLIISALFNYYGYEYFKKYLKGRLTRKARKDKLS